MRTNAMTGTVYVKCSQCGSVNRLVDREGERPVCGKCKSPLDISNATSDRPLAVTDENFHYEVITAKIPVLVDFFATWCGACRSLEPALEAVASRHKGKLKVGKLDVQQNPANARTYQIRATPTLIIFREGQLAERVEGALPETQLEALVEKYIR
jgi:thioredoxin 2